MRLSLGARSAAGMTSLPAPLGGQPSADAEPGPGHAVAVPPHSPRVRRSVITALAVLAMFAGLTLLVWAHGKPLGVDARLHGWALAHRSATSTALAPERDPRRVEEILRPGAADVAGGWAARCDRRPITAGGVSCAARCRFCVLGLLARVESRTWSAGPDRRGSTGQGRQAGSRSVRHTTAATLAASLLAWAVGGTCPWRVRLPVWVAALTFALAVGWSRVWLGTCTGPPMSWVAGCSPACAWRFPASRSCGCSPRCPSFRTAPAHLNQRRVGHPSRCREVLTFARSTRSART